MVYGMAEQAIMDLGLYLKGKDPRTIKGLCYISKEPVMSIFKYHHIKNVWILKKNI